MLIGITSEAIKFITDGGFKAQAEEQQKSKRKHLWVALREWTAVVIAILSLAYAVLTQAKSQKEVDKVQERIDSIKTILKKVRFSNEVTPRPRR